jgi:hypothetical protein
MFAIAYLFTLIRVWVLPKTSYAVGIHTQACYFSNALKTAAVNAVVVFLANRYRYVFASVFPKVHEVITEAQWPNHHVLIVAKHVLRMNLIHCAVD